MGVSIAIQGSIVGNRARSFCSSLLARRQRIVCFTTRITKLGAQSTVRILSGYFPEAYMLSRRGELHGRAVAFTDLVYTGFSL